MSAQLFRFWRARDVWIYAAMGMFGGTCLLTAFSFLVYDLPLAAGLDRAGVIFGMAAAGVLSWGILLGALVSKVYLLELQVARLSQTDAHTRGA